MGKTLVIVESPAKAKTIEKYLGAGYDVVASKGHIKDLRRSWASMSRTASRRPTRSSRQGKVGRRAEGSSQGARPNPARDRPRSRRGGDRLARRRGARAADPRRPSGSSSTRSRRRGSATASTTRGSSTRTSTTPSAHAACSTGSSGTTSPRSCGASSRSDSRAGRVQSVALRLIVDREREIEAFVPEEYWNIGAALVRRPRDERQQARSVRRAALRPTAGRSSPSTTASSPARSRGISRARRTGSPRSRRASGSATRRRRTRRASCSRTR